MAEHNFTRVYSSMGYTTTLPLSSLHDDRQGGYLPLPIAAAATGLSPLSEAEVRRVICEEVAVALAAARHQVSG